MFQHPQVGAPLLLMWSLGDMPPARNIYSRSAKTFFIYTFHLQGILKEKIWDNSHVFNTGPDGGYVKLLAPAQWVHFLLPLPSDHLEGILQQGPHGTESPMGEPIWEEKVKLIQELLSECKSLRLVYTPWLSLQATRCIYLQAYNEHGYPSLDYVAHAQLKTWAQLSYMKEKKKKA